jgi:hypothetical protein
MQKISIWDMDFYYKKSFQPNPIAMKISSFYKQKNCIVNFVTEDFHINLSYDEYFIIREKTATPKPPGKLIDDKRSRLIGKTFKFFDNFWKPTSVISAVRPDYMLYPENEKDAYYNANIAQFYHEGKKLKVKQPFENTKNHHKKTLVIDKEFWDASDEDIESCLQELKEYKNIAFLHPINLQKIIKNWNIRQMFIKLHFSQGTIFKFRNNYGQEFEDVLVLFEFIDELKAAHSHVKFTNLPIKAVTLDHWERGVEGGLYDLERCLQIADEGKRRKIHIRLVSPLNRFESPFWYYFEVLEYWTVYLERLSYIEMMLHSAMKKSGSQWFQILNNPRKWFTPNTYFLLSVMTKQKQWIEKYGYRQWDDNFIDKYLIDWDSVNTYIGSWEKDMKNTEAENE